MNRVAHHPAWPGARRGDQVGTRLRGRAHWSSGRADARPVLRLCCTTTTRTYSEELNFRVEFLPCAGDEASMPCLVARCAPLADEKIGIGSDSLPLITLRARPHGADPLCLTPCRSPRARAAGSECVHERVVRHKQDCISETTPHPPATIELIPALLTVPAPSRARAVQVRSPAAAREAEPAGSSGVSRRRNTCGGLPVE